MEPDRGAVPEGEWSKSPLLLVGCLTGSMAFESKGQISTPWFSLTHVWQVPQDWCHVLFREMLAVLGAGKTQPIPATFLEQVLRRSLHTFRCHCLPLRRQEGPHYFGHRWNTPAKGAYVFTSLGPFSAEHICPKDPNTVDGQLHSAPVGTDETLWSWDKLCVRSKGSPPVQIASFLGLQ